MQSSSRIEEMEKNFLALAALLGALSVGLGAFGAHALENRLSANLLETYETAVRYQFYHVIALALVGLALARWPDSGLLTIAGWLFVVGILVFSGSLYLLVFSGLRWLGAITPIGGVAFIGGWIALAVAVWRS
jgi:uncharacterized membrane protein YgdD (TMEM256/DUF423 family)